MLEKEQKAVCNQCNTTLDEVYNLPLEKRTPCPTCSSLNRLLKVNVSTTVQVRTMLKLKHKVPGIKKPQAEITSGEDLHRDSGTWRILERVIDRGKKWYTETIKDRLTGEVIKHTSESLDLHTGHGSARGKQT